MNYYKIILYIFFVTLMVVGPIYAVGKIVLPSWLKSQIAEKLPEGSKLSVGKISSSYDLSINYENLLFSSKDDLLKINLLDFIISPQFSISEPLKINAKKAFLETEGLNLELNDLNSLISIDYSNFSNSSISGEMKSLKADELAAFSSISFLLEGFNSKSSNIEINADKIKLDFVTPRGPISAKGDQVTLNADLGNNLFMNLFSEVINLDLDFISGQENERILNAKNLEMEMNLLNREKWSLPLKIKLKDVTRNQSNIFDEISFEALGEWKNSGTNCTWIELFIDRVKCGKLTNVTNVDLKMIDGKSLLNFIGNGYCVTPKAGCLQKIQSKISTRETTTVFSKIMDSGVANPLFTGIILGSLLGSPAEKSSNYEHEVSFKVEGSKISVNGKQLIN